MKRAELEQMSADQLWKLHLKTGEILAVKLAAEKEVLEERLRQLQARPPFERRLATFERRQYPTVVPKFRNPDDPSETWAGRGKQPRWLAQKLKWGKSMDDFRIEIRTDQALPPGG